jgi:hypothetical protein
MRPAGQPAHGALRALTGKANTPTLQLLSHCQACWQRPCPALPPAAAAGPSPVASRRTIQCSARPLLPRISVQLPRGQGCRGGCATGCILAGCQRGQAGPSSSSRSVRSCSRPFPAPRAISPFVQVMTTWAHNAPRGGQRAGGLHTVSRSRTRSLKLHLGITFRRCPHAGLRRWPRALPLPRAGLRRCCRTLCARVQCQLQAVARPTQRARCAGRARQSDPFWRISAPRSASAAAAHRRQRQRRMAHRLTDGPARLRR